MPEDKNKFIREESIKWNTMIDKCFGKLPKIQKDPEYINKSKAFQIGSNFDLLQAWIFPKHDIDDHVTSLLVCKSWGKAVMEEIWQPADMSWRYLKRLFIKGNAKFIMIS